MSKLHHIYSICVILFSRLSMNKMNNEKNEKRKILEQCSMENMGMY